MADFDVGFDILGIPVPKSRRSRRKRKKRRRRKIIMEEGEE